MAFQNGWRGPDIVSDGLVLYLDAGSPNSYRTDFGTTWKDMSGNNYSGSLVNGPTFNSSSGGSIVFDGIDDYGSITNTSNFQLQNLSISIGVNPSTAVNAISDLFDYDHASTPLQGWVIQTENATANNNYYFAYYDGSVFQPVGIGAGAGVKLTNSIWQNITYIKNGTSVVGYLNGIQSVNFTGANSTISYQSNRNSRIGGVVSTSINVGNRYYKGNIANILVYNRALSSIEILQNYNAQKSRFGL
jgi:hypothetical protein